jgi:hypothetical protein
MFIVATFHECEFLLQRYSIPPFKRNPRAVLMLFRTIRAYGLGMGPDGTPLSYLRQNRRWDNILHAVLFGAMICFGDALVVSSGSSNSLHCSY